MSVSVPSAEAGTTTQATSIFSFIDYSLALYIFIGVAVVYSIITLIFCVLVVLNCCVNRKSGIQRRVSPYANLGKRPLSSRLETIFEENESKCSSQTSLTAAKQQKAEALTFSNQNALEKETAMGPGVGLSGIADVEGSLSIANKSALEQDSGSDEELKGKGALQANRPSSDGSTRMHALSFSNRMALERENSSEEDKATKKGAVLATGPPDITSSGTRKHASNGTALEQRRDNKTTGKGALPAIRQAPDVGSSTRKPALSFSNRTALEREISKDENSTKQGAIPAVNLLSDVSSNTCKHALSFSNRTALERELSEESKAANDNGKLERGTDITTSFRRPVPLEKMNMNEKDNAKSSPQISSNRSPFLQHIPRGASISPADVKVPYTDHWEEPASKKKDLKGVLDSPSRKSRPTSVSSTGRPASTGSPFSKRKNQAKEIPSSDASTLTKFKKKTSTAAFPPNTTIQPQEGIGHSAGKVTLPPLKTPTSKASTGLVGVATSQSDTITSSPARRRPKPTNPVRSSPSASPLTKLKPLRGRARTQGSNGGTPKNRPHSTDFHRSESPLQAARAIRDSTPGIVAHSLSAAEQSKSNETPSSSAASIGSTASFPVTVDVLAKKLEPVQKKWYIIGSQLKVPSRHLNLLRNEGKAESESCLAMCEEWVSKFKEAATWPKVVDVLKTDLVDEKVLACDLEQEFCWVESNTSKTWL